MGHFLEVAELVLEHERRSMSAREIVDHARGMQLWSDRLKGKTPWQTMKAKISVDIRTRGEQSQFVRTAPGRFYLRRLVEDPAAVYDAPPLRPPSPRESVLVIPASWFDEAAGFQGITRHWKQLLRRIQSEQVYSYADRMAAEQDNFHKQILTYVMVTRGAQVLAFKRGNYSRVAEYLRGSHCIGFGGHVNAADVDLFNQGELGIINSAARELIEELDVPELDRRRLERFEGINIEGILNDDSSPVGRRHLAVVLRYEVSSHSAWSHPKRNEKSVTQLRWFDPSKSRFGIWDFEYWSQLCLLEFYRRAVNAQPAFRIRRKNALVPPHLLMVLGAVGSGKSEATDVLKKDYEYEEINSGRVLARVLGLPPVPETPRELFQAAAWEFISRPDGPDRLASAIWAEVVRTGSSRVLIDGLRQKKTLFALRALASGTRKIALIYVHTPPNVAFELYARRESTSITMQDFLRVRSSPVEMEVEDMISSADAVVYNWLGRSQYRTTMRSLIDEAMKRKRKK